MTFFPFVTCPISNNGIFWILAIFLISDKFFGETERNLREALAAAAALSPCVLWVDEIEKGISSGDYDSGTSRRVLATLLTWMAEHRERVFVVATANDISSLPPELMRKGRFDEIFFVDLPGFDVRRSIFAIHLAKRGFEIAEFDLDRLAAASEEFSGAEIEQAVISASYGCAGAVQTLSTALIELELITTKPLSVTMAEDIQRLRDWAQDRTVGVD
jgi:SpoVK/Ycf46/Vps4 family AAA+-type ATPase